MAMPYAIGQYRVLDKIGSGGFGSVSHFSDYRPGRLSGDKVEVKFSKDKKLSKPMFCSF